MQSELMIHPEPFALTLAKPMGHKPGLFELPTAPEHPIYHLLAYGRWCLYADLLWNLSFAVSDQRGS